MRQTADNDTPVLGNDSTEAGTMPLLSAGRLSRRRFRIFGTTPSLPPQWQNTIFCYSHSFPSVTRRTWSLRTTSFILLTTDPKMGL